MRALGVSVVLGVVAIAQACATFSDAPSSGTDGGAAEGGVAPLDGSAPVDGATVEGCPPGGTRFDDSFAPRMSVQGAWASMSEESGSLSIVQDSLRVVVPPASTGATAKKTRLYFTAPSPARRACASFRMIVSEPAGFDSSGYDTKGRTVLAYFGAELTSEEFYHGVSLDASGLHAYVTTSSGATDEARTVKPAGADVRVLIDVDYEHASTRIRVGDEERAFPNSYQISLGLPTPGLSLGVNQVGQAPAVDLRYDDVVIVVYP